MSDRPLSREETRAILSTSDSSLLDVIDNLLTKGVVLSGDVVLGIAGIDLIYARLSVLLCAADRLLERRDDVAGAPRP
jgi:Gas vesicle protein